MCSGQAPSGSGYALENRTIVSDVLPNIFRSSNVLRLAPFFRAQRDALVHPGIAEEKGLHGRSAPAFYSSDSRRKASCRLRRT
jgi:hypothetical protein